MGAILLLTLAFGVYLILTLMPKFESIGWTSLCGPVAISAQPKPIATYGQLRGVEWMWRNEP
jgi:hypothetical protein